MDYELISRTALFQGCSPSATENLLYGLKTFTKKYKKGAPVYLAGTPVTDVGIVLYGTVQIENNDLWGNKNIISLARAGEVFAEAYACIPDEPMMVDVIAMEEAEILFLNVAELFRLAAAGKGEYSHLIHNMTMISARKNLLLSRRILHTSSKKIRDRLLSYLSYQAGLQKSRYIDIPLNRQQLADYLSLDRSALSKELGKMKKEGLLDYHKNSFVLKDIEYSCLNVHAQRRKELKYGMIVLMATVLKSKIRNTSSCLQVDSVSLSIAGALLHDLFNFLSSPVPFRMQG